MSVESLTNVARRNSAPHNVGKSRRYVIERLNAYARLVGGGQHGQARPQARAENADALEALLRQPRDCAPRIEHRLSAHLDRAGDIRAHDVVGPCQLGRHSNVVIRQAHAKRRYPKPRERSRESHVPLRVGIPLRQNQHRTPPGRPAARRRLACSRKPAGMNGVVLSMRRHQCARKP